MKNNSKIAYCGDAPVLKGRQLVVGVKQLKKAVISGAATAVFLAENADPALTQPLADLCSQNDIHITWVPSMTALGRACGIEVGAAAAAALD